MINFSEKYDRKKFHLFLKQFLPEDLLENNEELEIDESNKYFKNAKLLGTVSSLDDLVILEIERNKPEKSRMSITKELFKFLENNGYSNALVITFSKIESHYRFSLINSDLEWTSETKVKRKYSNPKRLSFVLGENQRIHTAFNQLIKSGKISNKDDLKSRFNVELINKEFFIAYKKMYLRLEEYLNNDKDFKKFLKRIDLKVFIFTKKLLGQIVFCYFLQKKGCIGASENTSINNGEKNFLRLKYNQIIKDNKNYYNNFLEYLFYNGFNKENPNSYVKEIKCKIPYLNGGLFEELKDYDWKNEFIEIPNKVFSNVENDGILDVLDLYNFTIDENVGLDVEIAIDPEMLGKVFENLLPENLRKKNGAFYTPRRVVSYMCEQSLSNYLINCLYEKEINKNELDNFIKNKDLIINLLEISSDLNKKTSNNIIPSFIIKYKDSFQNLLENIKICDPAIGSGAFAIGMLQEVTKFIKILNTIDNLKISNYELKRNFIENNIYGVDFDPGAVEITKLRLWLSLIIEDDLEKMHPLPNLDFKIMQGDSLAEEFLGISLKMEDHHSKDQQFVLGENPIQKKVQIQELFKMQNQYFNLSSIKPKKNLKRKIENLIKEIFINELPKVQIEDPKKIKFLKIEIDNFNLNYSQRDFFPWSLYFNDVLKSKKGFDIVVGNPPYVDSEEMTRVMPEKRKLYNKSFYSTKGNWDLYIPFYELGFNLLNEQGVMSYIAPNKWLSIKYGKYLREFLDKSLIQICKCEKVNVFDAGNSPSINFFNKSKLRKKIQIDEFKAGFKDNFLGHIPVSTITIDNWGILLSNNIFNIIKIKDTNKSKINDYYDVQNPFSTAEAYSLKKIIKDDKFDEDKFYFINTGTIDPFVTLWGEKTTTYLKSKYMFPTIIRNKLKKFSLNRYNQSNSSKLIITAMRYFESFFDNKGNYVAGKSTIIIFDKEKKCDLKSLNILLNSKFISLYIKSCFSALGIDGGINFSKDMVENLPLPNNFIGAQNKLNQFHDEILEAIKKKLDPSTLINLMDDYVFELYQAEENKFHE